jgi:DNA-binding MarR family transcriptional regulator
LNAARLLNAVGQDRTEISDIRAYLGLDSGLLSRLLRGLEDEGLVLTQAGAQDARRRTVSLTAQGRAEFDVYENLSNAQAQAVLDTTTNTEAFLKAVDLVASVFGQSDIEILDVDVEDQRFARCMKRYETELVQVLNIEFSLKETGSADLSKMRPPKGNCLIATSEGIELGCVGVTELTAGVGEVKRLWVSPATRGLGLSRRLMEQIEERARRLGMTRLVLDTNGGLSAALGLYRSMGWTEIERYNDNPYAQHFFEKRL